VLLGSAADINVVGAQDSPLIRAIDRDNPNMVRLLLESGADLNLTLLNNRLYYRTLRFQAVAGDVWEIVRLLLEVGADTGSREGPWWGV
jgi:ankyrin repeat protein